MAAVVGIFVGQAWSGVPWFEAGAQPEALAPFSFGTLLGTQLLLMGWVEGKRWVDYFNPESQSVEWATPWSRTSDNFASATGQQGYPGGKFFDPLSLAGEIRNGQYIPDPDKLERLQLAEIKHARLAMVAMLIFYFEAGQGKTPLLPLDSDLISHPSFTPCTSLFANCPAPPSINLAHIGGCYSCRRF